jgi:hypothetical protein
MLPDNCTDLIFLRVSEFLIGKSAGRLDWRFFFGSAYLHPFCDEDSQEIFI